MMISIIMVLVSLVSTMQPTDGACPTGWDSVGPGCYKFTLSSSWQHRMSFREASPSCNAKGGKLVVFNSKDEMVEVGNSSYVVNHISTTHGSISNLWVGCTDQVVEGTFTCEDGTQLDLDSDLWRSDAGEPTSAGSGGGTDDCVYYYQPYNSLTDYSCTNLTAYSLCEVEPLNQNPTTHTPHQTTTQDPTTQTPQQTTTKVPPTQTPQQTTTKVLTTRTEAQATNQVSTTQTPATDTNKEFATTVADEASCETSTGVTGVTRACQPGKSHLKSSVFSRDKDNEGRYLIGYCLTDHVMETVQMVSLIRCTMMCNGITGCKSFNYKGGVCELNEESKTSVGSRYLAQSDGCTYYELV